jgi:hypothetical protein
MPTPVRVISQIYEGFCCSPSGGDSDRAVTSQPVWEVEEGWGLREEGVLLFVQAAGGHRHFGFDGDCCGGVNNLDGCPLWRVQRKVCGYSDKILACLRSLQATMAPVGVVFLLGGVDEVC